jgi:hypothetical protein
MSSVDPLAVAAAQGAATQSGVPDASLDLGAVAQILQSQLAAGDVLEATILPAQGGQDLILILGQTVVAQLPPDVHPGDVLLLQVTGFQGNQILVRNLGVQDPSNPVPTVIPELPAQVAGSGSAATLTTIIGNPPAPVATPQTPVPIEIPLGTGPPVAPPASVFVAASVRPAQAAPAPGAPEQVAAPQAASQTPAAQRAAMQAPVAAQTSVAATTKEEQPPGAPVDVELRLAASRAVSSDRPLPQSAPVAPSTPRAVAPPADARQTPAQPRPINLPTAPPIITRSTASAAQPAAVQSPVAAHTAAAARPAPAISPSGNLAPPQTVAPVSERDAAPRATASVAAQLADAVASKEPVRILAALRVPATPVTLAAARMATTATQQVQTALQNLEQVLSQTRSGDARVATLQTVTSFVSTIDPRNAQTLSAQLGAFVANVLGGAERKVSQLLEAVLARGAQDPALAPGAPNPAPGAATANATAPAHVPIVAEARAAERQMAISQDLKSTILSLIASPPAGGSPQLAQALNQSLTALTAMQFNTLIANQQDPTTLALSIPLTFYDGGQASNIRVSRDAPNKKSQRLDADNFHIAFVLDTQALGTVAIDLETVGRAVKVAVKTDRASAVEQFSSSLGDLRARLEHLRYTVTSTGAERVGSAAPITAEAPVAAPRANVDLQA